ncbi:MAG: hypothetical protein EXS05_21655 [Planctomycetaceae bacterium]|nr:hypothetical protein [Planctomycetaceae bacterium]
MIPAFGINAVPRQTEPDLDDDGAEGSVASRSSEVDEETAADDDSDRRKGNFLSRLLPGRDKDPVERRPLPVNETKNGTRDADDDDWDQ